MSTSIIIEESLLFLNLEAQSREDVIRQMSDNLLKQGLVYDTFKNAVIEREKVYATGLPSENFAVAIPHTDSEHVAQDALSIAILDNPVSFIMMGTADTELDVEMVFVLAIKNAHNQMMMLRSLMELFQNSEALNRLKKTSDKTEFIKLLKESMPILNENT